MAIITEEPDSPRPHLRKSRPKPKSKPTSPPPPSEPASTPTPTPTPPKSVPNTANPFHFWFYFTILVSLVTLSFVLISSLSPQDPKTWFLNLPPILRQHYSSGRTIKVQTAPNHPQVEVFSIQQGPSNSDSRVLIIHGLGCSSFAFQNVVKSLGRKNILTVAIDLPGSGFSDKSITVIEEHESESTFLEKIQQVYEDITEKGLFWGFDQLVEQGYVNLEETKVHVSKKERIKSIELGSDEMGRVLGQVVDTMGLAPVDLVLHDSALGLSANWIIENRQLIRSLIVLDGGTALPLPVFRVPIVKDIVLGFRLVFERVLAKCCMASVGGPEADGHRILLKGRDGGSAVVGMGKKLNYSFDLVEWSSLEGVKDLPIQVIWSGVWSDEWTSEGRRIADALPQSRLVLHSGGRWVQESNGEEVAESIYDFVSSLPKPTRQGVVEDSIPEHIHELFSEGKDTDHHHHHHHHHDGHGGYPDAYGLGQGWGM